MAYAFSSPDAFWRELPAADRRHGPMEANLHIY